MATRAEDVAVIVNAVVDSYMELIVEEEEKERLERQKILKNLWENRQEELMAKRKTLRDLAEAGGSDETTLAIMKQFKTTQLGIYQSELLGIESEVRRAEAELASLRPRTRRRSRRRHLPGDSSPVFAERWINTPMLSVMQYMSPTGRIRSPVDRLARSKNDPAIKRLGPKWE